MSGIPFADVVRWLTEDGHLVDQISVIGAPLSRELNGACVDSRLTRAGCLFVALPGARTDGHNYVDQAVQGGATCALVASDRLAAVRRSVFGSVRLLPVDDTLAALQSLALRWRRQFSGLTRIGITGSNGKTTVKEMLASILGRVAPTVYSHGNFNSDIGLPMELLRIREHHRYGVFEMGMNRPGEMKLLAELVEPNVGLITNIGRAHIGMVGSQEAIAREKRAIFSFFTGDQTAVVPAGDRYADFLSDGVHGTVVRYSMESAGVTGVEPRGIEGSMLACREGEIRLALPGAQMVSNAIGVITVARLLDVPFVAIREGIEAVAPTFGRSQVIRGDVTVIQDCYNANPESMRSALELLDRTPADGRKIAILGAMKELGEESEKAHVEIASLALRAPLDAVWFVGDEFVRALEQSRASTERRASEFRSFSSEEWDAVVERAGSVRGGDLVLLKASRSLALERLTPVLTRANEASEEAGDE
ncbi:MAG: UDP-N-acetylmuramoyl-tripeptide--D-alanyl-D-alanine ligase [Spirochaetota bacterium]